MREIKFKAKTIAGEWVEGDLIHYAENDYRILDQKQRYWDIQHDADEIDPNTLCQFTGLVDKNGKEIYEGDIFMSHVGLRMTIEWQDDYCLYMMRWLSDDYQEKTDAKFLHKSEIIGNIHDK